MSPSISLLLSSVPILVALFVSSVKASPADFVVQGSIFGFRGSNPHVMQWGGDDRYEFLGSCDLVLVHNQEFADGVGMDIQLRTTVPNDNWWSYIGAAAVRIGKDVIEVEGGQKHSKYWINGVQGKRLKPKETLTVHLKEQEFISQVQQLNTKQLRFRLVLGNGDAAVTIETFQQFVRVDVVVSNHERFGNGFGLLGAFPDGVRVGRDKITIMDNENAFVREWRVHANETTLFHDGLLDLVDGVTKNHRDCAIGSSEVKQVVKRRRLGH